MHSLRTGERQLHNRPLQVPTPAASATKLGTSLPIALTPTASDVASKVTVGGIAPPANVVLAVRAVGAVVAVVVVAVVVTVAVMVVRVVPAETKAEAVGVVKAPLLLRTPPAAETAGMIVLLLPVLEVAMAVDVAVAVEADVAAVDAMGVGRLRPGLLTTTCLLATATDLL